MLYNAKVFALVYGKNSGPDVCISIFRGRGVREGAGAPIIKNIMKYTKSRSDIGQAPFKLKVDKTKTSRNFNVGHKQWGRQRGGG